MSKCSVLPSFVVDVACFRRKTTAVCVFDASTVRADSEQTLMIEFKHVFNGGENVFGLCSSTISHLCVRLCSGIRLVEVHAIWLVGVKEALPDLPVSKTVFRCDEDIPGFFSSTPPFCLAFEVRALCSGVLFVLFCFVCAFSMCVHFACVHCVIGGTQAIS